MLSGSELIVVALAGFALLVLLGASVVGIVTRFVRGEVADPPSTTGRLARLVRRSRRRR